MARVILEYAAVFAAGMALGLIYFGGLWWTLRHLSGMRRPVLLTVGSFLLRTALVVAGLCLITSGRWERLLVGLLGFLLMRQILLWRLGGKKALLQSAGKGRDDGDQS